MKRSRAGEHTASQHNPFHCSATLTVEQLYLYVQNLKKQGGIAESTRTAACTFKKAIAIPECYINTSLKGHDKTNKVIQDG